MKKFFALVLSILCVLAGFADDTGDMFQVKVAATSERNGYSLRRTLDIMAKKDAIRKYIQRMNSSTPEKMIEEICNEYESFVVNSTKISEKWIQIERHLGQLTAEYQITLKTGEINSYLRSKGFKQQANIELIVMEEPPTLGQMRLDAAFGNGIDGMKFFMQNYTTFQRRLRDAIVKKVGKFGFDVKLLEDNELYEKYKSKDGTLVGVFFDAGTGTFVINRDLLKAVRENNPDTLVLYYRVDVLLFESATRNVRATVAFNMKDLNTGVTKSIGARSFQFTSKSANKDGVIDDLSYCAEAAMNNLMNAEGAGTTLNQIAMSIKNAKEAPKGPLKLVVNASAFDPKVRKKALYTLKKEIDAMKIAIPGTVRSTNTTLTASIHPGIRDADTLYMEYISPILSKIGIELSDEHVHYSGNTVTIKP